MKSSAAPVIQINYQRETNDMEKDFISFLDKCPDSGGSRMIMKFERETSTYAFCREAFDSKKYCGCITAGMIEG